MENKKVECVDCGTRLTITGRFYAMFWQGPHPDITLDDELEHNEDFGPYCCICFNHHKREQKRTGSPIEL